ncbi:MAG: hypothetical protein AAB526_02720 [Patescibacteria group bacterium]
MGNKFEMMNFGEMDPEEWEKARKQLRGESPVIQKETQEELLEERVEQFLKDAKEILKNDKISEELKKIFEEIIKMLEENSQKIILQIQNAEKETEHALFEFEFK